MYAVYMYMYVMRWNGVLWRSCGLDEPGLPGVVFPGTLPLSGDQPRALLQERERRRIRSQEEGEN
jgi:hypothetical protein